MPKSLKIFLQQNFRRVNFLLLFISYITAKSFNQAFCEDLKAERATVHCGGYPEELRTILSYIAGTYGAIFMIGALVTFIFYLILIFFGEKQKRGRRLIFAMLFFIIFTFLFIARSLPYFPVASAVI